MATEITKKQMCIQTRSGIELWINEEDAHKAFASLNGAGRFVVLEGRMLNAADVVGIFKPEDMDGATRRKNGQWKCNGGQWHDRGEKCTCASLAEQQRAKRRDETARNCKICKGSRYILTKSGAVTDCNCMVNFDKNQ